jgi:hypothetical protein
MPMRLRCGFWGETVVLRVARLDLGKSGLR